MQQRCGANHPRVGDPERWRIGCRDGFIPRSGDALHELLDRFATARPVPPEISHPGADGRSADVVPALALPLAKIHFREPCVCFVGQTGL